MYSKQKQRLGFNCTAFLLTACASCISVSAYGAGKTFAKPSRAVPAKSSESYNIQPAGSALGTLGDDDCEDDYATQVMSRNQFNAPASTTSAAVAPAAKNESLGSQVQAQPKTPPSMESVALAALAKESKAPIESKESQTAKPVPTSSASRASISSKPMTQAWEIALSDKTLNGAISRWTTAAGWQLVWELPVDYVIDARTTVPGSFEEAIETVVRSMETAEIPLKAIFYKGNKVLRIVQKGAK